MFGYRGWLKESATDREDEIIGQVLKKSSSDGTVSRFFAVEYGKVKPGFTSPWHQFVDQTGRFLRQYLLYGDTIS